MAIATWEYGISTTSAPVGLGIKTDGALWSGGMGMVPIIGDKSLLTMPLDELNRLAGMTPEEIHKMFHPEEEVAPPRNEEKIEPNSFTGVI